MKKKKKKKNRSRWNQLETSEVLFLTHVSKNSKNERRKERMQPQSRVSSARSPLQFPLLSMPPLSLSLSLSKANIDIAWMKEETGETGVSE